MNSRAGWHKTDDWETEKTKKKPRKQGGKNVRKLRGIDKQWLKEAQKNADRNVPNSRVLEIDIGKKNRNKQNKGK